MLSDVGGGRVSECSGRPSFVFFMKENWICAWSDVMLSQTLIYYRRETFLLTLTSASEGGSFEIGRPRSRGWKNLDIDGQGRWRVLKIGQFSWTSYVYHPLKVLKFAKNPATSLGLWKTFSRFLLYTQGSITYVWHGTWGFLTLSGKLRMGGGRGGQNGTWVNRLMNLKEKPRSATSLAILCGSSTSMCSYQVC